MTACWDIETYSPDNQLPKPEVPDHKIFMIGTTFQWHHSDKQLLRVCFVVHPCDSRPDYLTVVCGTEKLLIKAFAKLVFKMKPDIFLGFNDSDYDWPWLIIRSKIYPGVLAFMAECFDATVNWKKYADNDVFMYNFKKEKVKLEADVYANGQTLVLPGYINIDVRTIFRQLYPTAEKSNLNFYLSLNKLSGKKDMEYTELFRIYREMDKIMNNIRASINTPDRISDIISQYSSINECNKYIIEYIYGDYISLKDKMAEIADYCIIDSQRCHELMKIRSVLMDRREVSNLSYTSIFDSIYRANGMKVRNLVIARGQMLNIRFSNISDNSNTLEGKYPGAYVIPPKKGLVTSKCSMEDRIIHAKLIDEYKDWIHVTPDELNQYKDIINKHGDFIPKENINIIDPSIKLRDCFIKFITEKHGRPITGLDFSSLYPSLIMAYNFSPEYIITNKKDAMQAELDGHHLYAIKFIFNGRVVRGWSIRHDNNYDTKSPDYKFGVYPIILKELFDSRNLLKGELHKWESAKEKIDTMTSDDTNENHEYDNICFNYRYIDSKQRALKVFMNTFYGESGNKRSPFFVLQLAGGITDAGKTNIKMIENFVKTQGCDVYYGDTDSCYQSMPELHFHELDKQYFTGSINKLEYWTQQVNITFTIISNINKLVNDLLENDNGTKFLKMAFEESLFPCVFLAKKKYYGIPHISKPNFNPKELFIRGLEVKKRGISEVLRKVCLNIMWSSVSLENAYSLIQLVEKKIDDIYITKWDFSDFIMTDVYKPNKQNTKVHTFVNRMLIEGITVKPFDRFSYVITKKNPYKYDERGRKKELQIGEKMELSERASDLNMDIDLDYYMKGSINGQLARLITYNEMFQTENQTDDDEELKKIEESIYDKACKWIDTYCNKYYTTYNSKGKIYQKVFKMSNKLVVNAMNQKCNKNVTDLLCGNFDIENIDEYLITKAESTSLKSIKLFGKLYVDSILEDLESISKTRKIVELQEIYFSGKNNLYDTHKKLFNDRHLILTHQIKDNIVSLVRLFNYNSNIIKNISDKVKSMIDIDNQFNEPNDIIPDIDNIQDCVETENLENIAINGINGILVNDEFKCVLNKLLLIYINLISNYIYINKTQSIVDYLKIIRTKSIGCHMMDFDKKKYISDNINSIMGELKNDI